MMKSYRNYSLLLFLSVFVTLVHSQAIKNVEVSNFSTLYISKGMTVYLTQSDKESLTIKASKEALDNIIVNQEGSNLFLDQKEEKDFGKKWKGFFKSKDKIEVFINFINLEFLKVRKSCEVFFMNDLETGPFTIKVSESSEVVLLGLTATDLKMEVLNSGSISAGKAIVANRIILSMASSSDGDFRDITSTLMDMETLSASSIIIRGQLHNEITKIKASSASDITLNIDTEDLELEVNSASSIDISGKANTLKAEASGAASILGKNLFVEKAKILTATGASGIKLNAKEVLEIHTGTAGKINTNVKEIE